MCVCSVQAAPRRVNQPAKATPPLTLAERNKILKECQNFLKTPDYTLNDINLFVYKTEDVVSEVNPIEEQEVVQKPADPSNDELLVLQAVGKAIKPEGSLSVNGKYVLCISGHRILKIGDILYAKYKDNNYPITLKSVTRKQFTLEINEKELTFQY